MQKDETIQGLLAECIRVTQSPSFVSIEFKRRETAGKAIELVNRIGAKAPI